MKSPIFKYNNKKKNSNYLESSHLKYEITKKATVNISSPNLNIFYKKHCTKYIHIKCSPSSPEQETTVLKC